MSTPKFKVWIDVEECDEENDRYEIMDLNFSFTTEFNTLEGATEFTEKLNSVGEAIING